MLGHFNWFSMIEGLPNEFQHVYHVALVFLFLSLVSFLVYRRAKSTGYQAVPGDRISILNIAEIGVEKLVGLLLQIIGHEGRKFLPIIGTTFIFILFCNLVGLIPGFLAPTDNINTNLACALFIFVAYNYFGFKEHGVGYLKQFAGPLWWLAPLIFACELVGHMFRPLSLSLRLMGNMVGDHAVLSAFSDLVPWGVPVIFVGMGIFISFIQAFVFTMLSCVYIKGAVSHDH